MRKLGTTLIGLLMLGCPPQLDEPDDDPGDGIVTAEDDGSALLGVILVIWDPLPIVEAVGDIYAEVEAPDGRVGRATLRVRVEWGPDAC